MNRADLNQSLLYRVEKEVIEDIDWKQNEISQFLGSPPIKKDYEGKGISSIRSVWRYASADSELMWISDDLKDSGYYPAEDLQNIYSVLFLPILRKQQNATIPNWFWEMPLGYACNVAQSRFLLDSFMPLSVLELSLLSDRKHTTIQQHCQRQSIKAIKQGSSWKIPPLTALSYLISVRSEPFYTHYREEKYQAMLIEYLESGHGRYMRNSDKKLLMGEIQATPSNNGGSFSSM